MKVQDILTDESKWTKGTYARSVLGNRVAFNSKRATKYCLSGAIFRACGFSPKAAEKIERKVFKKLGSDCTGITYWNDDPERTFAQVRGLIVELDI